MSLTKLKKFVLAETQEERKKPFTEVLETEKLYIACDGVIGGVVGKDKFDNSYLLDIPKQNNLYDDLIKLFYTTSVFNTNYFTINVNDLKKELEQLIIEIKERFKEKKIQHENFKSEMFKLSKILVEIYVDNNIITLRLIYNFYYGKVKDRLDFKDIITTDSRQLPCDSNFITNEDEFIVLNHLKIMQFIDFIGSDSYKQIRINSSNSPAFEAHTITASNDNKFALLFKCRRD